MGGLKGWQTARPGAEGGGWGVGVAISVMRGG